MRQRFYLLLPALLLSIWLPAQLYTLSGTVKNNRLEPLPFASVQIRGSQAGVLCNESGRFELRLDPGEYQLLITMVGYKAQTIPIVIKNNSIRDLVLEPDDQDLSEVVITGKARDRSEEIIKAAIRQKEKTQPHQAAFQCKVYIRATQESNFLTPAPKSKSKKIPDSLQRAMQGMAMAEIVLTLSQNQQERTKEERTGITKRGQTDGLFYLSTTEADFNLYHNLIRSRTLSAVPFISPVSWSGLEAYRFRLLRTDVEDGIKVYTIGIRPRALSNATIAGTIRIADSSWHIMESHFRLPEYHVPEYDQFEVFQHYRSDSTGRSLLTRQLFVYQTKSKKGLLSGTTRAEYREFDFNPTFPAGYFGPEQASTSAEAYKRDSSFWSLARPIPLTSSELKYIRYTDSVKAVHSSQPYLDSLDSVTNRATFLKIAVMGQTLFNRKKERTWYLPSVLETFQPLQLGGLRLMPSASWNKTNPNRKTWGARAELSYGFRNRDLNGGIDVRHMYNPFNRGFWQVAAKRDFEFIFSGDAWINMLKRSNLYLHNGLQLYHGLELVNGLFLTTGAEIAWRRSVSDYKTGDLIDSLFDDILEDNQAVAFEPYNAFYGVIRLDYTPAQPFIREPNEKIILHSRWPTLYAEWRKGIPRLFKSVTDFDYLEFGLRQELRLGILGNSRYTVKTGSFLTRKDLRLVDYKYQRRGDPLLFLNPDQAFQSLDSTFPVFDRFYEGHYVHEFNGALLNKIPLFKKLRLREVAGAGFLIAPERDLRYGELFAGVERVFEVPFNRVLRFKLGAYVVGSAANQFSNPVQFKIGITTWDKLRNRWF
jgi:hypothetical protein